MEEFSQFENEQEFFKALGDSPYAKNPFLVRTMAETLFNGSGTEGIKPGNELIRE